MPYILHFERVDATTWIYLSSLLIIALYFKFSRVWSVRNLDLIGVILLAPGLLLATRGWDQYQQWGYVWLFVAGGLFLIRLLLDPVMVRRPLLEPNLSVGGLTFLAASLLLFLMANVATSTLTEDDLAGSKMVEQLQTRPPVAVEPDREDSFAKHGPGYPLLFLLPHMSMQKIFTDGADTAADSLAQRAENREIVAQTMAIIAHLMVVFGMVMVGYWHFDNAKTGVAAATLYLLLPYTAQLTSRVDHVLPAALLIWAIVAYRRPLISGMLMGLAFGVIYYPGFLLPLWLGFYWRRGLLRFSLGVVSMLAVLVGVLWMSSAEMATFLDHVVQMFGLRLPVMRPEDLGGFWQPAFGIPPAYRIFSVLAAFVAMCTGLAIWPAQKNLGTLMSCSAAVMLGTQFWHAGEGGLYMAWYLPLLLLTIFRPNLEDRVALSVLGEGWLHKRRAHARGVERAA